MINFGGERMSKMRVYEYARLNNLTSKQVIDQLNKLNVDITNHMSTITAEVDEKLDTSFNKNEAKEQKEQKVQKEPKKQAQPAKEKSKPKKQKRNAKTKPQTQQQ